MILIGLGILIVVGTVSFIVAVCRTPPSPNARQSSQQPWQPSPPPRQDLFEEEHDPEELDWEMDDLEDDLRGRK